MATIDLLLALCLLTSCSDGEKTHAAIPSEKSNIVSNDLLKVVMESCKDLNNLTPQRRREIANGFFLAHAGTKENVKEINDSTVETADKYQIPIRTYTPLKSSNRDFVMMYIHGGGWIQGNLETHDNLCRKIANTIGVTVISVDYRLAPEHPFPTPLDDVFCVYSWIVKNHPHMEIVLSGDSAGGNLSAALCIKISREKQKKPYAQILLYAALPSDCESKSFEAYGNIIALPKDGTKFFYKQYAGDEQKTNPLVSPVLQEDVSVFPPTMFIAAECDVLLDGQILLYEKLKKAGIETNMVTPKGTVHGFMSYMKEFDKEVTDVLKNETSAFIDKIWAKK